MDKSGHYKQNYEGTNVTCNKVYINPNFNKIGQEAASTLSNSNFMYFNPDFPHSTNSQHTVQLQATRPRIHVNPNFIKVKSQDFSVDNNSQINAIQSISRPANSCYQLSCTQQTQSVTENHKNSQVGMVSRYCLVRQNENKAVKTLPFNTQQTVKVNKYKSISLNTVKNKLATDKCFNSKTTEISSKPNFLKLKSKYKISSKTASNNVQNTKYKLIKRNSLSTLLTQNTKQCTVRRVSITLNKSILKTNIKHTKKHVKGAMKKNNIPCPLFRKYGKCLRLLQRGCDYLHDKKHVSICRKFLAGICHNKECLLSHDLTDKKMPTCYFFLQGMCTKECCPYLHLKLNEKTKICSDFLKGYCEKGDQCLQRHVTPDSTTDVMKIKKQSCYTYINKINHHERSKICRNRSVLKKENTIPLVAEIQSFPETKDQRYFKDLGDDTISGEQCDFIKPTRCKLGTLPSFIQL